MNCSIAGGLPTGAAAAELHTVAVGSAKQLGALLLLFVWLAVTTHGVITFGAGALLRLSPETMAIASCANIGGATTIMPTAQGLRRMDLLLPGVLVGSLGNAIGTYAGFSAVRLLDHMT